MSEASKRMRKEWLQNDNERDKDLKTPDDVERFDNLSYGSDPDWNTLDVYRPKNKKGEILPVIVIVHGGGWVYGTTKTYQFYGMYLAQQGFAVVSYNYRLAPEHKYPASFEDSAAVMRWIYENAAEYGLDVNNIFLAGDSAGGMMACIITSIVTDPEYAALYPTVHFPAGFRPNALLLNCGSYKLFKEDRSFLSGTDGDLIHDLIDDEHFEEYKDRITVVKHINNNFPPAYIMTAQGDFLREQAPLLVKEYEKNHLEFVYRMYGDADDPLFHVFHVTIYNPVAIRCNLEECAFAREYIKK